MIYLDIIYYQVYLWGVWMGKYIVMLMENMKTQTIKMFILLC